MAVLAPNCCVLHRELFHREQSVHPLSRRCASAAANAGAVVLAPGSRTWKKRTRVGVKLGASRQDVSSRPMSVPMEAITMVEELDQVLEQAQELSQDGGLVQEMHLLEAQAREACCRIRSKSQILFGGCQQSLSRIGEARKHHENANYSAVEGQGVEG
ncbi:hypothetical protein MUK42_04976 [Musa troglodytarum]|uniref:Uncharacterized protein n=1 Tax=Musa troglodytarum TaxID=320322 RepID=A0A9E7I8Q5_9LILI|nr:hypothetical protein MUK42_04976 [Musa troglodytarum]